MPQWGTSLLDSQSTQEPMRLREMPMRPASAADFGSQIGSGLEQLGSAFEGAAAMAKRDATEIQNFNLQKGSLDWATQEQANLENAKQNDLSGSGQDFMKNYMAGFDQRAQNFLGQIKDPISAAQWGERMASYRKDFALKALTSELSQRNTWYKTQSADATDKLAGGIEADPSKQPSFFQQGVDVINSSGMSAADKEAYIRAWKNGSAVAAMNGTVKANPEGAFSMLGGIRASKWITPDEAAAYQQLEQQHGLPAGYLGGVARVESEGDGDKNSKTGSNVGRFQFNQGDIDTWLGPGHSVNSTEDQAKATAVEAQHYAARIQQVTGRPATAGELYLAHQQREGFMKMLQNPDAPAVQSAGSAAAITGNGGSADMTGRQFIDMWSRKFGGGQATAPQWVGDLTTSQRDHFQAQALQRMQQIEAQNQQAANDAHSSFVNGLEIGIHDNKVNQVDVDNFRKTGQLTDYGEIAKLEGLIKARDKEGNNLRDGLTALADPAYPWSNATKDHRDMVNAMSKEKGYDPNYDAALWQKTKIMPDRFAERLVSDARSGDPQKVLRSLSIAGDALSQTPGAFAGAPGQKELEEMGVFYQHHRDVMLESGSQAADAWSRNHDPLKPKPVADQNQVDHFRKTLTTGTGGIGALVEQSFASTASNPLARWTDWSASRAQDAFRNADPTAKAAVQTAFQEIAADVYSRTGNEGLAIATAQARIRDTYGVSNFSSGFNLGGQVNSAAGRVPVEDAARKAEQDRSILRPSTWQVRPNTSTFFTPYPAEHAYGEAVAGEGTGWLYKAAAARATEEANKGLPAGSSPVTISPEDVQLRPVAGRQGEAGTREAFLSRNAPNAGPVPYQIWYKAPSGFTHVMIEPQTFDDAKRAEKHRIADEEKNGTKFFDTAVRMEMSRQASAEAAGQPIDPPTVP